MSYQMILKFSPLAIILAAIVDVLSIRVWFLGMELVNKALLFLFCLALHFLVCWAEYNRINAEESKGSITWT